MVEKVLERELESHFTKECARLGHMTLKLNVMRRRGWPDRLVIASGSIIRLVELKTTTGEVSDLQKATFLRLERKGVPVIVIRTKQQITNYLESLCH